MTPASILAKALEPHAHCAAFLDLVRLSQVRSDIIRHAINGAKGHATDAGEHLRLCAVVGIDPIDGHRDTSHQPGELDRKLFAMGVRMRRYQRKQSIREAAREIGISVTTVSRIENGKVRGIDSMLAACRYIGVHPFHYVAASGFTKNLAGNTLSEKDKSFAA
jgi:DNA-binding Xre family transcriptional regulator